MATQSDGATPCRGAPTDLALYGCSSDRSPLVDVELRPLAVQLGLGDIRVVSQPGDVAEALAEHRGNEASHSHLIVPKRPRMTRLRMPLRHLCPECPRHC